MLTCLVAAAALTQAVDSPWADRDGDGLCDSWETKGFGPLDPKSAGCKPDHADLVIVFRPRPGLTPEKLQPTIDRLTRFYAEMPHQNPDGKPGLHLVPVVLPPLDAKFNNRSYAQLYDEAMPEEWRGLGHGVLVENSPGGGGQANRPDWCGTGYNSWTIVHEVGHQLGLPHEPKSTGVGSPLHTSLMNYDYLYQFDGSPDKVHFSTGRFASLRLKMTDLDEVLPFPYADLEYLSKRPGHYTVKKIDETHTAVDWNRNGVVGEHHVRANIDDGYSVGIRGLVKGPKVSGSPAVAAWGGGLYNAVPEGGSGDKYSPTPEDLARLAVYRVEPDGKFNRVYQGPPDDVASDVSALGDAKSLWLAHQTPKGWKLTTLTHGPGDTVQVANRRFDEAGEPVLAMVKGRVSAVVRGKGGELTVVDLRDRAAKPQSLGLTSLAPAGVAWRQDKDRLAVVTVEDHGVITGVMVVHELARSGDGWKEVGKPLTVGGEKTPARCTGRPVLLVEDGQYQVYCKGHKDKAGDPGLNYLCRQIATGSGWWTKMMGNEWAFSRSVGGVCRFGGDIVYAYRWHGGPEDNTVWLHRHGSGIHDGVVTDFDEVSYIFEQGLRDSLRAVQNEQWKVNRR
ncbi:MAG: hypothetical protein KF857_04295 [Fimbriimonadaceae bacterium]|nr:hypothetical protein [Fimbriimonadaceae bacterium]